MKLAALRVQGELERLEFLELVPHHFLHVSLRDTAALEFSASVDLKYERVNYLHTAVVAEVDAPGLRALDPDPLFLPHMSLAYVRRSAEPDELRAVLEQLRETSFGLQHADELLRVHVELSRERGLEPWTVVDRVGR